MQVPTKMNGLTRQVQSKSSVNDEKKRHQPKSKKRENHQNIKAQLYTHYDSAMVSTEERRSGSDRRQNEEIKVKRFDPRNKNDRRKCSAVLCMI